MSLTLKTWNADGRLGLSVEEIYPVTPASRLLWHISRLPGVRVLAKKSWIMTDDFEAFFTYKGHVFLMQTPFVNVDIRMKAPGDEAVFQEIESHIRKYEVPGIFVSLYAMFRYFLLPFDVPNSVWPRE